MIKLCKHIFTKLSNVTIERKDKERQENEIHQNYKINVYHQLFYTQQVDNRNEQFMTKIILPTVIRKWARKKAEVEKKQKNNKKE